MRVSIHYSQAQLLATAQYIWEHNPFIDKWPTAPKSPIDIVKQIHAMVIEACRKNGQVLKRERDEGIDLSNQWVTFSGSGGYLINYNLVTEPGDENPEIEVEFSVNPAIGDQGGYVVEVIDSYPETV